MSCWSVAFCLVSLFSVTAWAEPLVEEHVLPEAEQDCLMAELKKANNSVTVGQLRHLCQSATDVRTAGAVMRDMKSSDRTSQRFLIEPHKANYILPLGYQTGAGKGLAGESPKHAEVKYQVSFKSKIEDNLLGKDMDLYFAYTQQSYWQLYDTGYSSPFRENDYEPEFFLDMPLHWEWNRAHFIAWRLGVVHQSNGRGPDYSRSWNRLYTDFIFENGNAWLSLKPWWRIPENPGNDDNRDIQTYMGHAELTGGYRWGEQHLTVTTRNWWESSGKGAVQLDYSIPFTRYLRWNVELFNGYGENLLDYNQNVSRISFGIMLEDGIH
jgi:phospholipase A1